MATPALQGDADWLRSQGVGIDVVQAPECIALMEEFIAAHPALWKEDIGE